MNNILKFIFVLTVFGSTHSSAQETDKIEFWHDMGAGYYYAEQTAFAPTVNYWPRLIVDKPNKFSSISIGAPIGFGIYLSTFSGGYLALDAPVTLDFNIGDQASTDVDFEVGGFVGAGYGANLIYGIWGENSSFGPLVHAGFRTSFFRRSSTIRFSFLLGIGGENNDSFIADTNPNVYGLSFFYSLSQ